MGLRRQVQLVMLAVVSALFLVCLWGLQGIRRSLLVIQVETTFQTHYLLQMRANQAVQIEWGMGLKLPVTPGEKE